MIDIYLVEEIIVILINLIGFWLMFLVCFANKKERLNQWFVAMTFFVILWINFAFLGYNTNSVQSALIFYRLNFGSVALFLICSFYFYFIYFLGFKSKYRILEQLVLFFGIVFVVLSIFTNFIIKDVVIEPWGAEIVFGYGNILFNIYSIFIGAVIIVSLIGKYFKSCEKKQKIKTKYFLFGTSLFILSNIIFNVFSPLISNSVIYQHFGDYSAIFLLGSTAYAIVKHELMGIKTLITQILIAIISLILLLDIFVLSDDIIIQLLKFGVLIAFLYFSRGMVESVRKEKKAAKKLENANKKIKHYVHRLEDNNRNLEEGNEDLKALLDASDTVIENMDSRKIAQGIVDIIPKSLGHLGNKGGVFVFYDRKKKCLGVYAITESRIVKKAKKLLGKSYKEHTEYIDDVDNLVAQTIKEKKIFVGNKLDDFIAPTVSVNVCKMIQKLVRAKSFVSVPLYSGGNVMGVLLFVGTKNEKKITQRDKNILYMFSSHIGNAVENARLYEQTNIQIKEMERLNNDLGKANVKLKELLEVKNEFLHITSHQLRTPLTAIRGMISMWYDGDFDDLPEKEKRRMVKRILTSTERLNNITNDMLDALELEGGFLRFQFKPSSIGNIIRETINTLKSNFEEKKIYIKIKVDSETPDVEVEPNYIRQVFMNIIDNACKYTKKGGVDVSVKKRKGNYVEVKIVDSGIGVSKIDNDKVFEKFARGKNAIEENASGSGLGLFIARKIISAHDGKIDFESDGIGQGTTVRVLLKIKHK